MLVLFALFLSGSAAPNVKCGGILSAFTNDQTNGCNYIDIAQPSGKVTRTVPWTGCSDVGNASNGSPQTAFSYDEHAFFYMTGSGRNIYWVDDSTVETQLWTTLPEKYNYTLGMVSLTSQGLYIYTTSTLYNVPEPASPDDARVLNTVLSLESLGLDETAVVSADFWETFTYITHKSNLHVVNSTDPNNIIITTVQMQGLDHVLDLEPYSTDGYNYCLLAMQDDKLYFVDIPTGTSKYIMDVPVASGSPRVNAIGPGTFFYSDAQYLYSVDIPTAKLLTKNTIDYATTLSGFYQYHP